jgi:hypothetical protein
MMISPLAGKVPEPETLLNVPKLIKPNQAQQMLSHLLAPASPHSSEQTVRDAKEAWRNEGNPN